MREKWKGELQGSEIIMTGIRERDCVIRREGGEGEKKFVGKTGLRPRPFCSRSGPRSGTLLKVSFFLL